MPPLTAVLLYDIIENEMSHMDYEQALRKCNDKGLVTLVAEMFGMKKGGYIATILRLMKNNGYINADLRKWKRQTNLVHIPRNKDSKADDIIADKLQEKQSQLKESINSIEQEIKKIGKELILM